MSKYKIYILMAVKLSVILYTWTYWVGFAHNRSIVSELYDSTNTLSAHAYSYVTLGEGLSKKQYLAEIALRGPGGSNIVSRLRVDSTGRKDATNAMRYSDELAVLELEAMKLVEAGKTEEARVIVFGRGYAVKKNKIIHALDSLNDDIVRSGSARLHLCFFVIMSLTVATAMRIRYEEVHDGKDVGEKSSDIERSAKQASEALELAGFYEKKLADTVTLYEILERKYKALKETGRSTVDLSDFLPEGNPDGLG